MSLIFCNYFKIKNLQVCYCWVLIAYLKSSKVQELKTDTILDTLDCPINIVRMCLLCFIICTYQNFQN